MAVNHTRAMIPLALTLVALAWTLSTVFVTLNWETVSVKDMGATATTVTTTKQLPQPPYEHLRGKANIPSNIPLPLPKSKVSVVLMNFSRPRMIRESSLMQTFLAHPNVDEVLLLHANPKTSFEYVHPKVVNIDATIHNEEMGLSLRFYFCQLAKNDWVIHVDDDMEFPATTLNDLLIEFGRNTRRIVGRFGRDMVPDNSFEGYSSTNTHKSTEVVLTKLMVMERNICPAFFTYAHLIWDDVVLYRGEGPMWNGEDIFMSLVANHVYGGSALDTNSANNNVNNNGNVKATTDDATSPSSTINHHHHHHHDGENGNANRNNYAMDWLNVYNAPNTLKDYNNGKLDISGGMAGLRFWDWQWWQSVLRRNRHYSYRGQLWKTARQRLADLPRNVDR